MLCSSFPTAVDKIWIFAVFSEMALATAYSQKPKVVIAEQLATAEGEYCVYGPTLI